MSAITIIGLCGVGMALLLAGFAAGFYVGHSKGVYDVHDGRHPRT